MQNLVLPTVVGDRIGNLENSFTSTFFDLIHPLWRGSEQKQNVIFVIRPGQMTRYTKRHARKYNLQRSSNNNFGRIHCSEIELFIHLTFNHS